jgi:hypothetical protein
MFTVRASYLALLQAVAAQCGLPYASVVFEVAGDGSPIYGVEVDVPCTGAVASCHSVFFWAPGYELQAIVFFAGNVWICCRGLQF